MAQQDASSELPRPLDSIWKHTAWALAFALPVLDAWRPLQLSHIAIALFASGSLLLTALLWVRRPTGAAAFIIFLPAIPLAYLVLYLDAGTLSAQLLAAVAFAFQARYLFVKSAERNQEDRNSLAKALKSQLPDQATVYVDNDIESELSAGALQEGHLFRLVQGQIIPADGLVTFGSSFVDETLLPNSKENLQIKGMGSRVLAGTRNKNGSLLVRATAVGEQTFSARLAKRIEKGAEFKYRRLLAIDALLTLPVALVLFFTYGPSAALKAFLLSSGAGSFAILGLFEFRMAKTSAANRYLWGNNGAIGKWNKAGMLVFQSIGALTEGRPKLAAIESISNCSEDAALALLAPIARKLETPASFAILQELCIRNIPLQQSDFFQATPTGGTALVAGEEIHWIHFDSKKMKVPSLFEPFITQAKICGDEVILLERQSEVQAALAFRDPPLPGVVSAIKALRGISLPVLLVSSLPKSALARLQSELDLEHVHGETDDAAIEILMNQLMKEKLAPAWLQTSQYHPRRRTALASLPFLKDDGADLIMPQLDLPSLANALISARMAMRRLRFSLCWIFGAQAALLIYLLLNGACSGTALALAGVVPGLLILLPE